MIKVYHELLFGDQTSNNEHINTLDLIEIIAYQL